MKVEKYRDIRDQLSSSDNMKISCTARNYRVPSSDNNCNIEEKCDYYEYLSLLHWGESMRGTANLGSVSRQLCLCLNDCKICICMTTMFSLQPRVSGVAFFYSEFAMLREVSNVRIRWAST